MVKLTFKLNIMTNKNLSHIEKQTKSNKQAAIILSIIAILFFVSVLIKRWVNMA